MKIVLNISLILIANNSIGQERDLKFLEKKIAFESFESVGVFDVDNDSILDLVSGTYWYQGPDFLTRHFIGQSDRFAEYYDDFSTISFDVNQDGQMDFITGAWFRKNLRWYENPGNESEWREHEISKTGNIEAVRSWDIDEDGIVEIVPNTPNDSLTIFRFLQGKKGKSFFEFKGYKIFGNHGHGLGFGDLNGDGRGDFVIKDGWLEAPKNPFSGKWIFHQEFDLGKASVPIIIADVNKDGLSDFIVGQDHDYGLHWYEQKSVKKKNDSRWIKHEIDSENSQFHTMDWVDIDNDGYKELITGKRYRAHTGNDPGSNDPYGIYYYKWNGNIFVKYIISIGIFGETKGTGIYFEVIDINDNGYYDIVVAGKDGLSIFYNLGYK